ncbi:hypothetical protein Moror_4883 [Moniliophthora roreri MCA 2997]|uniref:Uncharacterized protein n=1 Tax=Moniliophthora roreri (strain MCA 2997) TaxID=1381753 RepID=V2W9L7_MONRO|nr:hypothetical protein Moror_4883 [Moniliophthora roreri MCA 2997]
MCGFDLELKELDLSLSGTGRTRFTAATAEACAVCCGISIWWTGSVVDIGDHLTRSGKCTVVDMPKVDNMLNR